MLEKKIERYKRDIALAEELKTRKYADQDYYDELIAKFEKLLRLYKRLKEKSETLDLNNASNFNNIY
ncbi:MAG: hypothetical protein ACFFAH_07705 [Promethearchaeota archaeon]